jgi:tetratricopeptide (TPR) repeat protein
MELCERESVNLVELTHKAAEAGHHDLAWRIPVLVHRFYRLRKSWEYGIPMLKVAIESARHIGDRNGESLALSGLALFHADLQQLQESRRCSEQALAIARKTGHRWGQGIALQVLALTYQHLRRFEESIDCSRQSLTLFRETGDRVDEGNALVQLGQAAVGLRRLTEAVEHFQTALTITDTTAYWFHVWAHNGLSYAFRRLGRYPESIQHAECALDLSQEIGDWWGQGEALYSLGRAQQHAGRHEAAHHSFTRALAIFDDLHTPQADRVRERLHALGITHSRPGPAPPNPTA